MKSKKIALGAGVAIVGTTILSTVSCGTSDNSKTQITEKAIIEEIQSKNPYTKETTVNEYAFDFTKKLQIEKDGTKFTIAFENVDKDKTAGKIIATAKVTNDKNGETQELQVTLVNFATSDNSYIKQNAQILKKINASLINQEIKREFPFNQSIKASKYAWPSVITLKIDSMNVAVNLEEVSADDENGTISWRANADDLGTNLNLNFNGALEGFDSEILEKQKAADSALAKLTPTLINKAINAKQGIVINNTIDPNGFTIPSNVVIPIDGIDVKVTLRKDSANAAAGSVTWTSTATAPNSTAGRTDIAGDLTGFETTALKNTRAADAALAQLSPTLINAAIRAKHGVVINDTVDPNAFSIPPNITVSIDGIDIAVALAKSSVNAASGSVSWTSSAIAPNTTTVRTDVVGNLTGFEATSHKNTRAADAALAKLTPAMINTAIENEQGITINNTIDPNGFNIPPSVIVRIDNLDITVTLTKGSVDAANGSIAWTSSATTPNATAAKTDVTGNLAGFETTVLKNKATSDAALAKLTPALINAAIRAKRGIVINDAIDPSGFNIPQSVNVRIDGIDITVTLTKNSADAVSGSVSWTSSATTPNTTIVKTNVAGDLTGFETTALKNTRAADAALAKLTPTLINAAIRAKHGIVINNTVDPNVFSIPQNITVPIDGIDIVVALTKGAVNAANGSVAWTSSATASNTATVKTNVTGNLTGFETTAFKNTRAADAALAKLTPALINKAIKGTQGITINNTIDPNGFSIPPSVIVRIGNLDITVTLTKGSVDAANGSIAWTSSATTPHATAAKTNVAGDLTGFITTALKNKTTSDAALAKLTPAMINKAIKNKHGIVIDDTVDPNGFKIPPSVIVRISGIDINVSLTKGSVDAGNGSVAWTSSATTPNTTIVKTNVTGSLTGFETTALKNTRAADAALAKLTSTMINDAIRAKHGIVINNTISPSVFSIPKNVVISIDGMNVTVVLTKDSVNDANGSVAWTSSATTPHATTAKTNVTGSLTGFETTALKNTRAADAALAKLTSTMINNAIRAKHGVVINNTVDPSRFITPPSVNVVVDNLNITVTLTKGSVNATNGSVAWTSSATTPHATAAKTNVTGSLTGFETTALKNTRAADAALAKLTSAMINKAIKNKHGIVISDTVDPNGFKIPPSVIVRISGIDINVSLTKGSVNATNGSVAWTSSATTPHATAAKTNVTGDLAGFETTALKRARAINVILAKLTVENINKAIETASPSSNTKLASGFALPPHVSVTIDKINIKVVLTNASHDDGKGVVSWTSVASANGTSKQITTLKGKYTKLRSLIAEKRTKLSNDIKAITKTDVDAAIKSAMNLGQNITTFDSVNVPERVTFTKNGELFEAIITRAARNTNANTLGWNATIIAKDSKYNVGELLLRGGVVATEDDRVDRKTNVAKNEKEFTTKTVNIEHGVLINSKISALRVRWGNGHPSIWQIFDNKISGKDVSIFAKVLFENGKWIKTDANGVKIATTSADFFKNEANALIFQNHDTLNSSKNKTTNTLKIWAEGLDPITHTAVIKAKVMSWDASGEDEGLVDFINITSGDAIVKNISGTIANVFTDEQKANKILKTISESNINDLITKSDGNTIDSTVDPNSFTLPKTVSKTIDGIKVVITLTKTSFDSVKGSVSWDAKLNAPHGTQISLSGIKTGFKNKNNAKTHVPTVLDSLTPSKINKKMISSRSISHKFANNYHFLPAVQFNISGNNIVVTLTKKTVDISAGTITWSAVAQIVGTNHRKTFSGTLSGFETNTANAKLNADNAINAITIAQINHEISSIRAVSSSSEAKDYVLPRKSKPIKITQNGIEVEIHVAADGFDNDRGIVKWIAKISADNTTLRRTLSGTLTGFSAKSVSQLSERSAIKAVTSSNIHDEILKQMKLQSNSNIIASKFKLPSAITVNSQGHKVKVSITKKYVNDADGRIYWKATLSKNPTISMKESHALDNKMKTNISLPFDNVSISSTGTKVNILSSSVNMMYMPVTGTRVKIKDVWSAATDTNTTVEFKFQGNQLLIKTANRWTTVSVGGNFDKKHPFIITSTPQDSKGMPSTFTLGLYVKSIDVQNKTISFAVDGKIQANSNSGLSVGLIKSIDVVNSDDTNAKEITGVFSGFKRPSHPAPSTTTYFEEIYK